MQTWSSLNDWPQIIRTAELQINEGDHKELETTYGKGNPIMQRMSGLIQVGRKKAKYVIMGKLESATLYIALYDKVRV